MKRFVLVRHGQSEDNAGMNSRGLGLTHLTTLGQKQADVTARNWRERPDLIVVSPYIRTVQTAAPTRERFPDVTVETWPIEEFRQLGKVHYEGQDIEYRRKFYKQHWKSKDPDYFDGEGAESIRSFAGRLDQLDELLQETDYQLSYIFCHGLFLRSFMLRHIWGSTRPMIENMQRLRRAVNSWHMPNCALIHGHITAEGIMLLGPVSVAHLPEELHS